MQGAHDDVILQNLPLSGTEKSTEEGILETTMVTASEQERSLSTLSPEIFIIDDNIINTQESVGGEEVDPMNAIIEGTSATIDTQHIKLGTGSKQDQEMIRRSERLKMSTNITTMEKNEATAKKRNLEGNYVHPTLFLLFLLRRL